MTLRKILLWAVFVDFTVFSIWVLAEVGYFGIWQAGISSPGAMQLLFDLVVCCLLIVLWLKKDAEQLGMNPYPWIVSILLTGSLAILLYLLVREYRLDAKPGSTAQTING